MKLLSMIIVFALMAATSHAKIYKWVDENGTIHFSDKAYTLDAKEIKVRGTGLEVEKNAEQGQKQPSSRPAAQKRDDQATVEKKAKPEPENKVITEADYKIIPSVGKLGADIISISGRISAGPKCDDMVVNATATNDNGLSGSISVHVRKLNSFGSTIFEGNAKVAGSAEDYGFWEVSSVTVRCNDEQP